MSRRFYLPSQSAKRNASARRQSRIYGLLIGLVLLQVFTIGLLVTRTGGVKQGAPESMSVAQTVSDVQSLVKPSLKVAHEERLADTISAAEVNKEAERKPLDLSSPTRVQLLNGCGVRGFTKGIAPILQERGFDVREAGNADNFRYEYTLVLDRRGDLARALALADSFGISHTYVRSEPDDRLVDIDVTLIVGRDYRTLKFHSER
jgi:hypothetical protein